MQTPIQDNDHLSSIIDEADKSGYEGIMVRKDVGYEGKKKNNTRKKGKEKAEGD